MFQYCVIHNNQYLFDGLSDVTKINIQLMSYILYVFVSCLRSYFSM